MHLTLDGGVKVPVVILLVLVCLFQHVNSSSRPKSPSSLPNVIVLFADDLGYGDLSCYGHPTSSTPNIDQMAREGLVFSRFYCSAPVCSPSRAGLLTGRYQTRSGIYPDVLHPFSIGGLPLNETTIAEGLKSVGYSTGVVGKWHLGVGENKTYLPTNHGFDYYLGIPYSHDMCPCVSNNKYCFFPNVPCAPPGSHENCDEDVVPCPIFEQDKIVQQPADFFTLSEIYSNAATSFIKAKAAQDSPFFLYMAFQHTHDPQFAGRKYTNSSIRGWFGDALSEMDWEVGQIFDALKEAGVDNNTFVFFTSDNGPALTHEANGGSAGLLRCGKGTTWEGGQRVPGIAWWPGKITPGKTHEMAATLDLLPTIFKLTGATLPNVTLDGVDMSSVLFNTGKSDRNYFIHYPVDPDPNIGIYAVTVNQYKAHYFSHGGLCPNTFPDEVCRLNYSLHQYNPPLLYDLDSDPGEIYNLNVTEYSDILVQIAKVKEDFEATMVWAPSQRARGTSLNAEPCALPGCTPFPTCCRTDTIRPDTSRAIP